MLKKEDSLSDTVENGWLIIELHWIMWKTEDSLSDNIGNGRLIINPKMKLSWSFPLLSDNESWLWIQKIM